MTEADKEGYLSYKVTIGGETFEPAGANACYSISVVYKANKIPYAIITFIDGDASKSTFSLSSTTKIEPGAVVKIELGYAGTNVAVFKGIIVKHSLKLTGNNSYTYVECKDPVVKMTIGRKNRVFGTGAAALTDNANFTTIFSENGLSSRLTMKKTPYISQNSITQFYSTDWDFVLNRAEVNGKMILIQKPGSDYGSIIIDNPLASGTAVATFKYGDNLLDFDLESDAQTQFTAVETSAWGGGESQAVVKSTETSAATFSQLENTGITKTNLNTITSPASLSLLHGGELLPAELNGWRNGVLERAAHSKVKGSFKIYGDNTLNLGDVVALAGVGSKFTGNIVVTGIKHEYTLNEWFTYVSFGIDQNWHSENFNINAPAASGLLPGVSGLQIGKVLAYADDPAAQHRVKIKMTMFKATEVFWARMLFDYAGAAHGNFFWPEVDDEVLVGFLNDDPRNPVILGSMCSKAVAPLVLRPKDDNDLKAIITKKDLRIELDDAKKIITIKTPGGNIITIDDENKNLILKDQHSNIIEMGKDAVKITSTGELKLSATKAITISSSGGDVVIEGTNIKSTAKAKFEVSGNAGLELKTAAIAEIKGSLVKIN
jgi:phage protein D